MAVEHAAYLKDAIETLEDAVADAEKEVDELKKQLLAFRNDALRYRTIRANAVQIDGRWYYNAIADAELDKLAGIEVPKPVTNVTVVGECGLTAEQAELLNKLEV